MERIAERLVALLRARGWTCATAESCTGGGVGHVLTAVPGASAVYWGGVVSYDNTVKRDVLGVPQDVLARDGAVSAPCAAAMAAGVRRLLKTDLAVSVTGIAGPDGGTLEKPVGLVWFGLATPDGVRTEKAYWTGSRDDIRRQAIRHALGMLSVAAV